jgi:hypothetical protein
MGKRPIFGRTHCQELNLWLRRRKNVLANDVLVVNPLNIEFQRVLVGNHFEIWLQLARKLMGVTLPTVEDSFTWRLTDAESFSVKSMYVDLMNGHIVFLQKYIWKLTVPLKIKILTWFRHKKCILIKGYLVKLNWDSCKKSVFCDSEESINHLFSACPFARLIWRVVHFTFAIPAPANVTNMLLPSTRITLH